MWLPVLFHNGRSAWLAFVWKRKIREMRTEKRIFARKEMSEITIRFLYLPVSIHWFLQLCDFQLQSYVVTQYERT